MGIVSHRLRVLALAVLLGGLAALTSSLTPAAMAQGVDVEDRPIRDIRIQGLDQVRQQFLLNQINTKPGSALDQDILAQDIQSLTRLGRFSTVRAKVQPNEDGTVDLIFVVGELPILNDVQVVGNKKFSDQELLGEALLTAGDPRDRFLINRAREIMRKKYRDAGYFLADVQVDEPTLEETGILILRVREGPRVKVRAVEIEGNQTFPDDQIKAEVRTKAYVIIFEKGILSEDQLSQDVAKIRAFYEQRGYLDARVSRRIELSNDQKDANVVFVIDEGDRYTVKSIQIAGNTIYSDRQLIEAMTLKRGDVFSIDRLRGTNEALNDLYGKLGYVATRSTIKRVFDPQEPEVDIFIELDESRRSLVGDVTIRGNDLTQDRIVRRQIRGLEPGRPYDTTGLEETRRRLRGTSIISDSTLTIQGEPEDEVRDLLVEVEEANTGSVTFGAAISSDSGLFGAIDLSQRNFDAADFPESFGELATGRAFRGAGQYFSLSLQPGDEFQRYQVSFREPYLFDSDYFMDVNVFFFEREREDWTEERLGGTVGFGRRFGDFWSAMFRARYELVDVTDIEPDAVIDVYAVEGKSTIDTLGFFVSRTTVDSGVFPTKGTVLEAGIERAGALGGDYDFWRASAEWAAFFTVDEDFLERKTIVSLRIRGGYIFGDGETSVDDKKGRSYNISAVPLFERFYAGGHRTFRGFDYRGVGPRGIQWNTGQPSDDNPVGGNFYFLAGLEYNFPIYDKFLRGVLFVDTGTVDPDLSFSDYRVSVGTGVRLSLPFFGSAPFAFDFGFPILREDFDQEKIFSFDIAVPF